GALLGVILATAALAGWRAFGPANFPRMAAVAIDGRVLLFAGLVLCCTVLIAGVIPAWIASRALQAPLGSDTRSQTAGRQQRWVRRAFVVVQVAASAI